MKLSVYLNEGILKPSVHDMTIKQFMKRTGKTDERDALIWACRKGAVEIIKKLIDKGVDINYHEEGAGNIGATPLMYAVAYEQMDAVKVLLELGADVNIRTLKRPQGYNQIFSALEYADTYGLEDIADLLVKYGAKG